MENKGMLLAEASDGEIEKLVDNLHNRKKSTKYSGTSICVFALRNYLEGYKIHESHSGLLVYRRIMPKIVRRMNSWPRSEALRATMKFCQIFNCL